MPFAADARSDATVFAAASAGGGDLRHPEGDALAGGDVRLLRGAQIGQRIGRLTRMHVEGAQPICRETICFQENTKAAAAPKRTIATSAEGQFRRT